MGSPLTGSTVASTYTGLLKVTDTSAITSTLKAISDGSGNDSALSLATTSADVNGNFSVATNKLTVASATGNTAVAGTLGCTGNFAVNTNKFSVLAASGNTSCAGTMSITGAVSLSTDLTTNGRIVLNGNYGINQNAAAASNLFVAPTTFNGLATFTGGMQFQSAVTMTSDLTVAGTTTLNGNTVLGNAAGDTITVTGTPTFAETATFNGAATFNGNTTLGSDAADTVTVNAVVAATTKTTPANTDYVYIQDAAASNAFKKTLVSSLVGIVPTVTKKESSAISVQAPGSTISYQHSLGSIPTLFQAFLVCETTDGGYDPGDEISMDCVSNVIDEFGAVEYMPAFSVYCDTSYIYAVRNLVYRADLCVLHKDTGDRYIITNDANWKIKFRMISL